MYMRRIGRSALQRSIGARHGCDKLSKSGIWQQEHLKGLADSQVKGDGPRGVRRRQVSCILPPTHAPCYLTLLVQYPGITCNRNSMCLSSVRETRHVRSTSQNERSQKRHRMAPHSKTNMVQRYVSCASLEAHCISVGLRYFPNMCASHAGTLIAAAHSPASAVCWPHHSQPLQIHIGQSHGLCDGCQYGHVPLYVWQDYLEATFRRLSRAPKMFYVGNLKAQASSPC